MRIMTRQFSSSAVFLLSLFFSCHALAAETINTTEELANNKAASTYVHSQPLLERMFRLGIEEDKKFGLQQDCKSPFQTTPVFTAVLKPIVFSDGEQNPVSGVWMTRYRTTRCGEEKVYNALFFAEKMGKMPASSSFHAGSTLAGAQLISDVMGVAMRKAKTYDFDPACKTAYIFDMRVTQPPHKLVSGGKTFQRVWNEDWTFYFCGKKIDVPMLFIRDEDDKGTTFMIDPMNPEDK